MALPTLRKDNASMTTVDVPGNTMIADLDTGLRELLVTQLKRHGFDDIDVVFDTPTSEWASQLTRPTVNLFLCDLRKSARPGQSAPEGGRAGNRATERGPALRVDCIFAVTTWSKAVGDEHRLLSQVLGVLYAFPILDGHLGSRFDSGAQRFEIAASVGEQRPEQRADFWRSVGGVYKPALDYVVTLSVESGRVTERGPDVRTVTMRTGLGDRPRPGAVEEMAHVGGVVRDADGAPVSDAWIAVAQLGRLALSGPDGRFRIPRGPRGTHEVRVRGRDGLESVVEVEVPGQMLDVVLGGAAATAR
jgi:hypothetical protein